MPREYVPEGLDARVRARFDRAAEALRAAGAEVREVSLPATRFAIPAYYVLAPAEASSNLARYDGARFGPREPGDTLAEMYEATRSARFGREAKRRIVLGTFALSAGYHEAYYRRAQRARARIAADFHAVFSAGVDVLLTPTTPGPAFPLGERTDDPVAMYLSDVFTVTANLAGIPAASVPAGHVDGLPLGAQLLAPHWGEEILLAAAGALEEALA